MLAALHQAVADTRDRDRSAPPSRRRPRRAISTRRCEDLQAAKAELAKLEKQVARTLAEQQAASTPWHAQQAQRGRDIRRAAADQKKLQRGSTPLIRQQVAKRQHPEQVTTGRCAGRWPADGERRIRLQQRSSTTRRATAAPISTTASISRRRYARRSGPPPAGTVVFVGWNWADGSDPAWIVVIAHADEPADLVRPHAAAATRSASGRVNKGQIIAYKGRTGHATGAHLHWMVELNGDFVNPRLFL